MLSKQLKLLNINSIKIENNLLIFQETNIQLKIPQSIIIKKLKDKFILESKHKRLLGLYCSLIKLKNSYNIKRYKIHLTLHGVGYKINQEGKYLILKLGYSHDIFVEIPETIKLKIFKSKELLLYSYDLQQVTSFAHKLKNLKKNNAYKAKGLLERDKVVCYKEGKKR